MEIFKKVGNEEQRKSILGYHNNGERQRAIEAAEKYLKSSPDDKDIWLILAENYLWTNNVTEAERAVDKALSLDPKDFWARNTLASVYRALAEQSPRLKQQYLAKAEAEIELLLVISPNNPWANLEAARIYLAQGKADKALKIVDRALEIRPGQKHFLILREEILSKTK